MKQYNYYITSDLIWFVAIAIIVCFISSSGLIESERESYMAAYLILGSVAMLYFYLKEVMDI